MRYSAIIAEYDPFHNGHSYHIQSTKNAGADGVAVIMSGNFTQRGYPAILPREVRAESAVLNGADLVIELPVPWSCASAEVFARGAISIIDSLRIFDTLSFGSCAQETNEIVRLAEITSGESFQSQVGIELQTGISYPRAVALALEKTNSGNDMRVLLSDANVVLACEYVKALNKFNSEVKPLNIKRIGAVHSDKVPKDGYASATWLREEIYNLYNDKSEQYDLYKLSKYISQSTLLLLNDSCKRGIFPINRDKFDLSLMSVLRTLSPEKIKNSFEVAEGLENRIYKAVRESSEFSKAADKAKTKRFTHARIRRVMLSAYLGIDESLYMQNVPYARVLAMNDTGCSMLAEANKNTLIPIITRTPEKGAITEAAGKVFELNAKAEDLYNLCLPVARNCGTYLTSKLFKI